MLFNLAARSHFHRLEDFTDGEWRAAQQDEVDLVFYLTRAAWPHLKESRGVVVNMASLSGEMQQVGAPLAGNNLTPTGFQYMRRHVTCHSSPPTSTTNGKTTTGGDTRARTGCGGGA